MCHNSFFSQYFVNPNVPGTVLGSRDTLATRTNKLKAMLICMQLWFSSVEHTVSKISQLYIMLLGDKRCRKKQFRWGCWSSQYGGQRMSHQGDMLAKT